MQQQNPYSLLFMTCSSNEIEQVIAKSKKKQLIWQTYILSKRRFRGVSSVHFQTLWWKKIRSKYYNKQITTRDIGNVQSHDQEQSKLNNTITSNNGAHTLTHE